MYNRESILKQLNNEDYYIDKHSLNLFLHDWKIESIYEDEDGLEYYDDLSMEKIKRGISLKFQGYDDEQIISRLNRIEVTPEKSSSEPLQPILVKDYLEQQVPQKNDSEDLTAKNVEHFPQEQNKTFTLDVTSQTLQMIAEAVAKKIGDDIKNSDFSQQLIEAGGYKKDNEILSKQVEELLEHNKELASRIEQLESRASKTIWEKIWGRR